MYGEEFEFEEFQVAIAISLPLHEFDIVVRAFQWSGGDGVIVPGQDAAAVLAQRAGELLQLADARGFRPAIKAALQDRADEQLAAKLSPSGDPL